jgi:ribonuclease P/MRP protein subunit RPP20
MSSTITSPPQQQQQHRQGGGGTAQQHRGRGRGGGTGWSGGRGGTSSNFRSERDTTSGGGGRVDDLEYELRRRLPPRFHTSKYDIYLTNRTHFEAQFKRCKDFLDKKSDDIVIHALGNAITRAINLALRLEDALKNSVRVDVLTSTVNVTDDILALFGDDDQDARQRPLSAVHICVSRIIPQS